MVVVTVSTGFDEMFLNWMYWYNQLRLDGKLFVIAEDSRTFEKYQNCSKFATLPTDFQVSEKAFSYQSSGYNIL